MYCNLPTVTVGVNQRVRLVMAAVGSEEGMHSPRVLGEKPHTHTQAHTHTHTTPCVGMHALTRVQGCSCANVY